MTRHPERLPSALSERLAGAAASIYSRLGREVDIAVGGIPFLLATSQDLPQSVETIPIRKDQLDVETDPGEQSLTGWWRRSQSSFHEGAGALFQESSEDNSASNAFYDSEGIDAFSTPGQISLLNRLTTDLSQTPLATRVRSSSCMVYDGDLCQTVSFSSPTVIHSPAAETVVDGWTTTDLFWSITTAGKLYAGLRSSPGTATSWPLGASLTANAQLMWAKDRIWVIDGNKIWQPDLTLGGGTTQNPIYASPNASFVYTSMASSPGAVLFAGDDGSVAYVQGITLDSAGALPTLSGATVVAEFPPGEIGLIIRTLAGQYVGVGSSKGFRVGRIGAGEQLVYGPLQTMGTTCTGMAVEGRFFLATFSDSASRGSIFRIDTGTEVADGVFAYARDMKVASGLTITSLENRLGLVRAVTSDGTLYHEVARGDATTAWLQTGRIRFRTTEKKSFKYLNIEGPPLDGTILVEALTEDGGTLALGTLTAQGVVPDETFSLASLAPCRWISLRFTLGTTVSSQDPVLNSYLLRALPAVAPMRLITLPLLCFDREVARSGQRYGGDGYAADRLAALQALEATQETLTYQDFSRADATGVPVIIESIRYVQNTPSVPQAGDRTGGIIILQLRTVEA